MLLVYLFGSRVQGETGPMSDFGLAVLLARNASVPQLRSELFHEFSALFEDAPLDLIILNPAPIELKYAVIAQGQVLYEPKGLRRSQAFATS